jgi:hypothetical protein
MAHYWVSLYLPLSTVVSLTIVDHANITYNMVLLQGDGCIIVISNAVLVH